MPRDPDLLLVAMAGLPGTGKSTLARGLGERLGAPVLDKDRVRDALFGPGWVDYTRDQDDVCCRATYAAAAYLARTGAARYAILDGRTYARRSQVDALEAAAADAGASLAVIECVCSPAVARARLAASAAEHPAANRDFELYQRIASAAEPLERERLVLSTDAHEPAALVEAAAAYVERWRPA